MEAYPIPNQEAATVGRKLVDDFFAGTHSPSSFIVTKAHNLNQISLLKSVRYYKSTKTRTTPYHPQSDGLIERFNRTLLQVLATCVDNHPFEWEEYVQKVSMAYNTSIQATTGYSPFFLMFGWKAQLPVDVMYNMPSDVSTLPTFVRTLKHTLAEAFDTARSSISVHQECQQEFYNQRVHGSPHQPGSLVWLFNPVKPRGRAKKFHKSWLGHTK